MIKYKCTNCGCCFTEEEADTLNVMIDYDARWGAYTEAIMICPECSDGDHLEELTLNEDCQEYDEEFGCEGNCDDCPLNRGDDE